MRITLSSSKPSVIKPAQSTVTFKPSEKRDLGFLLPAQTAKISAEAIVEITSAGASPG